MARTECRMNTTEKVRFIVGLIIIILAFGVVGKIENTYSQVVRVIEVTSSNEVICVDENNYIWAFEGTGYNEGDMLKALFDTNSTDSTREDDKIINVKRM